MDQSDDQLIAAAKTDPQAYTVLYQKYVSDLYTFIYYRCGQHAETAEDLTAELFTKAFAQLGKFESRGFSYRALLYTIARNLIIDYYRVSHKQTVELDPDAVRSSSDIANQTDLKLMWKEISKFGTDVTEVFELRYLQGLSYDDIAAIVNKSPGSIRTLVSRTLNQLQNKLNP